MCSNLLSKRFMTSAFQQIKAIRYFPRRTKLLRVQMSSLCVHRFIGLRQYVQSQRMLAYWFTNNHQVHLIGALKISSVAFISWIEVLSSDLIPVLSLTNVEPVQYILKIFYDFFHKSIFPDRTLRVHTPRSSSHYCEFQYFISDEDI